MQCSDARVLMDRRLDGEGAPGLDAHLEACEACARSWSELVAVHELLCSQELMEPPRHFRSRALNRIETRLRRDASYQARTSARNGDVNETVQTKEMADRRSVRCRHQLDRIVRQIQMAGGLTEDLDDRLAGVSRLFAAPQDDRVSALQANGSRVCGHVGSSFVDEKNDPQRYTHFGNFQTVRPDR